jgi:hypothetical protein
MDTAVNELTVSPCGVPSDARTVATATPVANFAQASRKASALVALDKSITLILS